MNEAINHTVIGVNHAGKVFCDYAAGMLLQSALLVLVLLLADLLLRRWVRAVFRYCLWLLIVVKLVLPPTLALPTGIGYWLGDRWPAALPSTDRRAPLTALETAGPPASGRSSLSGDTLQNPPATRPSAPAAPPMPPAVAIIPVTRPGILFLFWLVGVLVFAALLLQRLRFVRGLIAFSLPADERFQHMVAECAKQVGIRREIELRVSGTMSSPALCGLVRPVILVPARILETLSPAGLKAILVHELAHLKRGDVWVNSVQTVLQVLHFYSPFVWLANAMIRRTRKEAVDETVLVALGGQAENYSNTLIDIGELALWKADLGLRLIGVAESERLLKGRIKHMLTRPVPTSARIGMFGLTILIITAALLLPMARAEKASVTAQPTGAETPPKAPVAENSNVFVDPNTGITFRKAGALSGPSDIIESTDNLGISPNGRFLLWGVKVVPLDGSQPFTLMEDPKPRAVRGVWSLDGTKVLLAAAALWVVPVNPETGRSTRPAERVYEGNDWIRGTAHWSDDSERITFMRFNSVGVSSWALSLRDKSLVMLPDPRSDVGKRAPDGKRVALPRQGDLWVESTPGTEAKMVADAGTPIQWSADSEWLLYTDGHGSPTGYVQEPRFFRFTDGRQQKLRLPAVGTVVGTSADGKKLFYYCASYDRGPAVQVAAVSGGPTCLLGGQLPKLMPADQFWSPDSASIVVPNDYRGEDAGLVVLPLSGAAPVVFRIDVSVPGKISYWQLSPQRDDMLFCVSSDDKTFDIWGAPVSWKQTQTTGRATLIFRNWSRISWGGSCTPGAWSPDGQKIAILQNGELWLTTPRGDEPTQLKVPAVRGRRVLWSPDSSRIAFYTSGSVTAPQEVLQVVSASGGEVKTVAELTAGSFLGIAAWSPDSKAMTIAKPDGQILSVSIANGQGRPLVNMKDLGMKSAAALQWSPDGKALAFKAGNQLFLFHTQDSSVTKVADEGSYYFWSPDSQWISYLGTRCVKTRPAGILWEMDIEEAWAKLAK